MNEGMGMIQDTAEQTVKNLLDSLVMEILRLDRMLLDRKCIETIAVEPEILRAKEELLNAMGIEL